MASLGRVLEQQGALLRRQRLLLHPFVVAALHDTDANPYGGSMTIQRLQNRIHALVRDSPDGEAILQTVMPSRLREWRSVLGNSHQFVFWNPGRDYPREAPSPSPSPDQSRHHRRRHRRSQSVDGSTSITATWRVRLAHLSPAECAARDRAELCVRKRAFACLRNAMLDCVLDACRRPGDAVSVDDVLAVWRARFDVAVPDGDHVGRFVQSKLHRGDVARIAQRESQVLVYDPKHFTIALRPQYMVSRECVDGLFAHPLRSIQSDEGAGAVRNHRVQPAWGA